MTDNERQQILKMIAEGKISADEGLRLMQALDDDNLEEEVFIPRVLEEPVEEAKGKQDFEERLNRFRRLWVIPVVFGSLVTVGAAAWLYGIVKAGLSGWFILAFAFFLLGVGLIALGVGSHSSRWIYVEVRQAPGESPKRIIITFPFPSELYRWGVRNFGHHIPERERGIAQDVMRAVFEDDGSNEPILVDVEDNDGQRVQVFIG